MDSGVFEGTMTINTSINDYSVLYTNMEYYYRTGRKVTLKVDDVELIADQISVNEMEEYFYEFQIIDKALDGKTLAIKCEPTAGIAQ